jgi:hypothetical protein
VCERERERCGRQRRRHVTINTALARANGLHPEELVARIARRDAHLGTCRCVCARASVRACVCACERASERECARARVSARVPASVRACACLSSCIRVCALQMCVRMRLCPEETDSRPRYIIMSDHFLCGLISDMLRSGEDRTVQ